MVARDVPAGETVEETFVLRAPAFAGKRSAARLAASFHFPFASGIVQAVHHERVLQVALRDLGAEHTAARTPGGWLHLDGKSAVRVDLPKIEGPFTVECWARSAPPKADQALLGKNDGSGFGLWWSGGPKQPLATGVVGFTKHPRTGRRGYVRTPAKVGWAFERWTHLALSYDGNALRLFVDGDVASEVAASGARTHNRHPLYVGADTSGRGRPERCFTGDIDEVRISNVARYVKRFRPAVVHEPDEHALVLLHFDRTHSGFFADDSGGDRHGWPVGNPEIAQGTRTNER